MSHNSGREALSPSMSPNHAGWIPNGPCSCSTTIHKPKAKAIGCYGARNILTLTLTRRGLVSAVSPLSFFQVSSHQSTSLTTDTFLIIFYFSLSIMGEELTTLRHIVNFLSWFWIPGAIHVTYLAIKLCHESCRCLCPVFYSSYY